MAIDSYMYFQDYSSNFLPSESQVSLVKSADQGDFWTPFNAAAGASVAVGGLSNHGLFEVEDYSFDIEQVLNIGSQSSGAGAGKITFNPFSITRKIDCASPRFFQMACSGTPFQQVGLGLRKSSGTNQGTGAGSFFLAFTFKLVAVKTISWAHDDESPKETVTFEYGGMVIQYAQQKQDGSFGAIIPGGWNKVQNIQDLIYSSKIGGSGA